MQRHFEHRVCHGDWRAGGATAARLRSDVLRAAAEPRLEAAGHRSPSPVTAPVLRQLPLPRICQKDQVCRPSKIQMRKILLGNGLWLIPAGLGEGWAPGIGSAGGCDLWPGVAGSDDILPQDRIASVSTAPGFH